MKKLFFLALAVMHLVCVATPADAGWRRGSGWQEGDLDMQDNSTLYEEVSATPSNPPANKIKVYAKDDGGTTKIYGLDSSGTETDLLAAGSGISNVVEDTTPQLGGDLDGQSNDITNLGLIELDKVSDPTHAAGQIYYADDSETLEWHNAESEITMQMGEELWVRVYNDTGSTITNGKVVYVSGTQAEGTENRPTIALAQADSASTSKVLGIATHDIETATYGYVTHFGMINGLNTASFSEGDLIYLSASSAGDLTTTEPESPNISVFIGEIIKSDASTGTIFLSVIGNTSGESGDATQLIVPARKGSAGTITKGQTVYISGYNVGQSVIEIELADADGSGTYPAIGLANASISNSSTGDVIFSGRISGIDTSSFSVGDTAYLSTTAGALATAGATGDTDCVQGIGRVARAHASSGVIQIAGAGRCNDIPNSATPTGAWDFGGATSIEVPNGTAPTVNATGEIAVDTTGDDLVFYGASSENVISGEKLFSAVLASPADSMSKRIFKARHAITISDIHCIVDPGDTSESVVIDIQECDATGDNCTTVDATITCDNDGAEDDGTLTNGTIDAGDWVNLDVGTVTGTVSDVTVTVYNTKDRE